MSRFIVAGTQSGVGKTTITAGLIAAFKERGWQVQPFKVGPDYIDPGYHTLASGRQARNLDGWMLTGEQVQEVLARNSPPGGISVIEGVMGLFDGYSGDRDLGSTAHIARLTGTPVILVMDGSKMARSAAAVALGFQQMDPRVEIAGLILNKLGGENHFRILKEALEPLDIPVLGYFPRETGGLLPERHLGLVPTAEMPRLESFLDFWRKQVERYLDLDTIIELVGRVPPLGLPGRLTLGEKGGGPCCRLAVARDRAFTFYYPENLELLEARGAEIVEVSLLEDRELPRDCQGLYIGGGFPELFARELSENRGMLASIREKARAGMPLYGECGGYMYLTRGIRDFEGNFYPLAGLLDCRAEMCSRRQALGYVLAVTQRENFLTRRGEESRGHEFHWSEITGYTAGDYVYRIPNKGHREDGILREQVLGSYLHLHFYSNPAIAGRFVQACAAWDWKR